MRRIGLCPIFPSTSTPTISYCYNWCRSVTNYYSTSYTSYYIGYDVGNVSLDNYVYSWDSKIIYDAITPTGSTSTSYCSSYTLTTSSATTIALKNLISGTSLKGIYINSSSSYVGAKNTININYADMFDTSMDASLSFYIQPGMVWTDSTPCTSSFTTVYIYNGSDSGMKTMTINTSVCNTTILVNINYSMLSGITTITSTSSSNYYDSTNEKNYPSVGLSYYDYDDTVYYGAGIFDLPFYETGTPSNNSNDGGLTGYSALFVSCTTGVSNKSISLSTDNSSMISLYSNSVWSNSGKGYFKISDNTGGAARSGSIKATAWGVTTTKTFYQDGSGTIPEVEEDYTSVSISSYNITNDMYIHTYEYGGSQSYFTYNEFGQKGYTDNRGLTGYDIVTNYSSSYCQLQSPTNSMLTSNGSTTIQFTGGSTTHCGYGKIYVYNNSNITKTIGLSSNLSSYIYFGGQTNLVIGTYYDDQKYENGGAGYSGGVNTTNIGDSSTSVTLAAGKSTIILVKRKEGSSSSATITVTVS